MRSSNQERSKENLLTIHPKPNPEGAHGKEGLVAEPVQQVSSQVMSAQGGGAARVQVHALQEAREEASLGVSDGVFFAGALESDAQLVSFAQESDEPVFAQESDEPVFAEPEVLGQSTESLRAASSPFAGKVYYFRGNYRRFLVFLFFILLGLSVGAFFALRVWWPVLAIHVTLFSATALAGIACLVFFFTVYKRRSIALDDFGLHYEDELRTLYVAWSEVDAIHLHAVEAFFNPYPLCYVRVVTGQGDEFGFSNFGNHLFGVRRRVSFGNPPYPIIDVRDADLLLALLVQCSQPSGAAPDLARLRFRAQAELVSEEEEESEEEAPAPPKEEEERRPIWLGLWMLMLKIGLKFAPHVPKTLKFLFQTVKPSYVGVSLGLYAIFFTWQFALILSLILLIHELGHVWAMRQEGMRIRGVYMIPFFGAATVTEDLWPSWYAQARVNLAGPLWGAIGTFVCFGIYLLFPSPFWLAAALWGALINLLNLLPVHPLDGGRILNAIAYSLRSPVGFVVTILFLLFSIVLSLSFGLLLLYILSLIGLSEFFREYMMRQRADKLDLIGDIEETTAREILLLKSITGINFGDRNAPYILEHEENQFKRLKHVLHAPPMTSPQLLRAGLATFAVGLSLFAFLLFMQNKYPVTSWAVDIFR